MNPMPRRAFNLPAFVLSLSFICFVGNLQAAPKTLIRNADLVVTMEPGGGSGELGVLEHADVLIDGDKIALIGRNLTKGDADLVDAQGKIVLPGFVDVHNHLWQSLIRGCGSDQELLGWLKACVFPLKDPALTPSAADTYAGVRLSTLDLLNTGVTTTVDWSHAFSPEFVRGNLRALADSGMRYVFAYYGQAEPKVLADMREVKRSLIDPNPRASFQVAAHPSPKLQDDLKALAALAEEMHVKMHVHLLESPAQREERPLQLLQTAGALGPNLLGAHGIHLDDGEIRTLAENGVGILHNPLSNMRLASGIIRMPELQQAGVPLGLGIDGGTNDTSDMFNVMRAAVGLQRAKSLRADVFPTVSAVLRMATLGGAAVLGMDKRIGSVAPGKQADLLIVDPGQSNFAPRVEWLGQLVFNGQPTNVEWVFVDGKPLKQKGVLLGTNVKQAVASAQQASDRLQHALRQIPKP